MEQPASSLMLKTKAVLKLFNDCNASVAIRSVCMDGAPWRKDTAIASSNSCVLEISAVCNHGSEAQHISLVGKAPCGRFWTAVASPFWPAFARGGYHGKEASDKPGLIWIIT